MAFKNITQLAESLAEEGSTRIEDIDELKELFGEDNSGYIQIIWDKFSMPKVLPYINVDPLLATAMYATVAQRFYKGSDNLEVAARMLPEMMGGDKRDVGTWYNKQWVAFDERREWERAPHSALDVNLEGITSGLGEVYARDEVTRHTERLEKRQDRMVEEAVYTMTIRD